jgi:choline dehydrogenase-like flavoprotein
MGTPKILLHSGIGPRDHLKELNIKVVEDLPVGENLKDHVTTSINLLLNQSINAEPQDILNPVKFLKYLWNGKDTPFSLGGSDAMGFVKLNSSSRTPDLSFILIPTSITFDYGIHLRKILNIRDDVFENFYEPLIGQTSSTILPILLHPKSVGTIRLKSEDFNEPLLIDPNYFAIQDDIEKLISGIRIIQNLLETPLMKRFNAELIPKSFPGCESHSYDSNDYWECYLRHMTLTMFHPIGTCRMGNYDDKSTVVLKNFQVKNIENLYVVDGSILSRASANPHAIIAMLAQKFSHDMNKLDGV